MGGRLIVAELTHPFPVCAQYCARCWDRRWSRCRETACEQHLLWAQRRGPASCGVAYDRLLAATPLFSCVFCSGK